MSRSGILGREGSVGLGNEKKGGIYFLYDFPGPLRGGPCLQSSLNLLMPSEVTGFCFDIRIIWKITPKKAMLTFLELQGPGQKGCLHVLSKVVYMRDKLKFHN